MWDNMKMTGDVTWLQDSIAAGTCCGVTDGSYMREVFPDINAVAFVLECSQGRGRLWGSFVERTGDACSYRGELLGLMVIHLILLAVNECSKGLQGLVHIYSDCLGALNKVENLPLHQIPMRCSHSDVLKTIMVNCRDLSFTRVFSHVRAHQDIRTNYGDLLSRPAQLNCQMDYMAKKAIWDATPREDEESEGFPLEAVRVFLGKRKLTSNKADALHFWVHRALAKENFHNLKILFGAEFESVDWEMIYAGLRRVPRMFQIWACKQVMSVAPTNGNMPWDKLVDPRCPSCHQEKETCAHVLHCHHTRRVKALQLTISLLEDWLEEVGTDKTLGYCIVEYARRHGGMSMTEICWGKEEQYRRMAIDQDEIGWRRFTEGMISKQMRGIQELYHKIKGSSISPENWTTGLVIKLLEITHGQWLYRYVQVQDKLTGTKATQRKEELQWEIERRKTAGDGSREPPQGRTVPV